jgi:hypothetical protein
MMKIGLVLMCFWHRARIRLPILSCSSEKKSKQQSLDNKKNGTKRTRSSVQGMMSLVLKLTSPPSKFPFSLEKRSNEKALLFIIILDDTGEK